MPSHQSATMRPVRDRLSSEKRQCRVPSKRWRSLSSRFFRVRCTYGASNAKLAATALGSVIGYSDSSVGRRFSSACLPPPCTGSWPTTERYFSLLSPSQDGWHSRRLPTSFCRSPLDPSWDTANVKVGVGSGCSPALIPLRARGITSSSTGSTAGSGVDSSPVRGWAVHTRTRTAGGRTRPGTPSHRTSTWQLLRRSTRKPESFYWTSTVNPFSVVGDYSSDGRRWSTLSSSTREPGPLMAGDKADSRRTGSLEKRGGYGSSSKPASKLKPPPSGPAPGGSKPPPTASGRTPK